MTQQADHRTDHAAAGPARPERAARRRLATGAFWLAVYLTLVLAPLLALLVGPSPPGLGLLWDFSMALGFAGLAMMGVQFVLTARFRRATAPFGIDIIYYFHRYLGSVVLLIVLAHPVLVFIDNPAWLSVLNPLAAPWHMTAGVISVAALLAVMITSLYRRPLRLAYEPWRVAHTALSVVALATALAHIQGVQYYLASPWKRELWRGIALSCLAVIGYVRLVRPWQLLRRPYRVVRVAPEPGDAWTLAVEPDGHPGLSFEPGQFAWITVGGSPFLMREHPFSVASSAEAPGGRLAFTIKELGDFTRTIGTVRAGEVVYVDGPYGAFTVDRHDAPSYVFIGGGIGVAPIVSMLRTLADRGDTRPLLLFYAYRRWDRLTFREELEALRARLDLTIVWVLEEPPPDWTGERGWITPDVLDRHLPAARSSPHYFVCGPEAMTQAMERFLHGLGVPMAQVHSELFELV
jgi:predicted ferric reductase